MPLTAQDLTRLEGVHPDLIACVKQAAELTSQPFCVMEGLRSLLRQEENIAKHVSWTLDSKHLLQADGYGHAVDLVPLVAEQPQWSWPLIYPLAWAMQQGAVNIGIRLRWGGVWDSPLGALPASATGLQGAVAAYCKRHPGPDDIDGPHFELITTPIPIQGVLA